MGDLPKPRIIACGSRDEAYKHFCRCLQSEPESFAMLLVDSEAPAPEGRSCADHLRSRDGWSNIEGDHGHLMVQCMEAWFIADKPALLAYYDGGFREASLPNNPRIEQVSKADVMAGLEAATRNTKTKGAYHKTKHGFDLLGRIDPHRVRAASPRAAAFISALLAQLS